MTPLDRDGPSAVTIRTAAPADYAAILEVWAEAGLGSRPSGRDAPGEFVRQLAAFPNSYLVAVSAGQVAGVVLGTHDGRKGWINRLAVRPGFQRRGIGGRLVLACDAAIRAGGIHIVAALIEPENQASLSLFKSLGFLDDAPVVYVRKLSRADV